MAVTSAAITNNAKEAIARIICDDEPSLLHYLAMGAGDDATAAAATDTDLKGNKVYKSVPDRAYVADYKAQWIKYFTYDDIHEILTDDTIKEIVVCQNTSSHAGRCLLRAVIDPETLGEYDVLKVTVTVTIAT